MGACNINNRTIYCIDNIYILRNINSNTIDLIYLDPPFNKNDTFIISDNNRHKIENIKRFFIRLQKEQGKFVNEDFDEVFKENTGFRDIWNHNDVHKEWYGQIDNYNHELISFFDSIRKSAIQGTFYYLIFMTIRLIEMHRILKDSGSIYLHCDPTMSHYLKIILDKIFGAHNFRNEIVWCYRKLPNNARHFQKNKDNLFFYSKTNNYLFNKQYTQPTAESLKTFETGKRVGYNANHSKKMATVFDWDKYNQAVSEGKIPNDFKTVEFTTGMPLMRDYWIDIKILGGSKNKQRIGYPTQKPLALLERIVKANTNEGDVVLDPFCGCATTCIAADRLNRKWVGVDWNKQAFYMVYYRAFKELGSHGDQLDVFFKDINLKTEPPIRTDDDAQLFYTVKSKAELREDKKSVRTEMSQQYRKEAKDILYEHQTGMCNGCDKYMRKVEFQIDHIKPIVKGGDNDIDNLQLLCPLCNSWKGGGTMISLIQKLYANGVIPIGVFNKQIEKYKDTGQ